MVNNKPFSFSNQDENGNPLSAGDLFFISNGAGPQASFVDCYYSFYTSDINMFPNQVIFDFSVIWDNANNAFVYSYAVINPGMEKYVNFFQPTL
jgi:hypothetical protein